MLIIIYIYIVRHKRLSLLYLYDSKSGIFFIDLIRDNILKTILSGYDIHREREKCGYLF